MKAFSFTLLSILFSIQTAVAQNSNASLLVQSPDGKTVKLVWFFKSWDNAVTGFDIKRKEGLQDWVKLNSEPILPGISAKKKLSVVESDKMKESMVKGRLLKLLASHKIVETDYNAYLQKLNSGDQALRDISNALMRDYDLALMSGFAFVDHTVVKKTSYQYGLFIQGTDQLLAKATWNYGEVPDLNVVKEITSKATTTGKGILLIWDADTARMKNGNVIGFNVYREGIRLNAIPLVSQSAIDLSAFTWFDRSVAANIPTVYSISAESVFGIEGLIKPYTYNPADHPVEYKKPEVVLINSLGFYFKDGTNVRWDFPKEYERFLKGFYVEKENMPKGYARVSALLGPSERTFTDKTSSQVSGYIRFRIVAVYNDKTDVPGIEKIYSYFPVNEPPIPQNLKAKILRGDKKDAVNLTWDPPIYGDTITDYYKVYGADPVTNKFMLLSSGEPVRDHKYTYLMDKGNPGLYKFCVSSISKNNTESSMSDTVGVQRQNADLPSPPNNK
jgi:hypothetical protein